MSSTGGCGSFADIYGARRAALQLVSRAHVLAARRPLVLSPQTLRPFHRLAAYEDFLAGLLTRAAAVARS